MKPLTPPSPHAIIMIGIPGSGKSAFAEHFADTFQAPIVNFSKLQQQFSLTEKKAIELRDTFLSQLLKTRRTLLIDGGANTKTQRAELTKSLTAAGFAPLTVWVQTDTNEARRRAVKPYPQGSGLSDDAFLSKVKSFQAPVAQEKPVVISGKHTYATQLKVVLRQLAAGTVRPTEPPQDRPSKPVAPRGITIR